jgi:glycosyltransferase involved in cell wall biosynthesis
VVTSEKLANDIEDMFGVCRDRILYAPLGPYNPIRPYPKALARHELGLPERVAIAAYVGKLTEDICDFLLRTAGELAEGPNPLQLMIVGGNPAIIDWTRRRVREMGLDDVVMLTGFVAPSRVYLYQAAADVLLLHVPDSFLTFEYCTPSKGFEYQAAGRRIVATDIPLFKELFGEDGERAIRVRERTPKAFADGVRRALTLPHDGREMTDRAQLWVSERSWEHRAAAILEGLRL